MYKEMSPATRERPGLWPKPYEEVQTMAHSITTTERWEAAFSEYIDALEAHSQTEPLEFVRGHKHTHTVNRRRLGMARRHLYKLDSEFCQRHDI